MTDRPHSCKESPDGRHHPGSRRRDGLTCYYCEQRIPGSFGQLLERTLHVGWNAPADDPDAHLGAVGGE